MTVLDACSSAAVRLRGKKLTSLFSATEPFVVELADLANETARAIAEDYDWQDITKLATIPGDGTSSAFDLPSDFDRMPKTAQVHSATWQTARFVQARDLNQWLDFQTMAIAGTPGRWIVLDGRMNILPAMGAAESARFYYISKNVVKGDKPAFTADGDQFKLDERLLTLGLIWRWRAQKRLEYAEDLTNYELAMEKAVAKNKSLRSLVVGSVRVPAGVDFAFPGTIVP